MTGEEHREKGSEPCEAANDSDGHHVESCRYRPDAAEPDSQSVSIREDRVYGETDRCSSGLLCRDHKLERRIAAVEESGIQLCAGRVAQNEDLEVGQTHGKVAGEQDGKPRHDGDRPGHVTKRTCDHEMWDSEDPLYEWTPIFEPVWCLHVD